MNILLRIKHASGGFTIVALAALVMLIMGSGQAFGGMQIPGISGTTFNFSTEAGLISTPDGGSMLFWGYKDESGLANAGRAQYPGPTLILTEGQNVEITLFSTMDTWGQCASMVFPGHDVAATGGTPGLLTRESCSSGEVVTYSFIAREPGTYMYHSGTSPELQIEMGLVGAIIVRPADASLAYNSEASRFDHENLFLLTSLDPLIHYQVALNQMDQIDMTDYFPVYWMINGRAAPDNFSDNFVGWMPYQPYNASPRMRPGEKVLMRIIGAGMDQHPFHFHGNNADQIARDGRLLLHPRSKFTTLSVQGQTVDQIFTWTGANLGWDLYGPVASCTDADNDMQDDLNPGVTCHDAACVDGDGDGFDDTNWEFCADHGKAMPVTLPEAQNLAFGGWWSGSPYLGDIQPLPPGEGGLNPYGGYFFMWHSHAEKELTNFDIFPGGMMSMMVIEPPYVEIP